MNTKFIQKVASIAATAGLLFSFAPLSAMAAMPTITSMSSASRVVNGGAFALTLHGFNFVAEAVVRFNGIVQPTTLLLLCRCRRIGRRLISALTPSGWWCLRSWRSSFYSRILRSGVPCKGHRWFFQRKITVRVSAEDFTIYKYYART